MEIKASGGSPRTYIRGRNESLRTHALPAFGAPSLSAETPGGLAVRLTALQVVADELADYAPDLRPRPHTAGDPAVPKAIRAPAFVKGGLIPPATRPHCRNNE